MIDFLKIKDAYNKPRKEFFMRKTFEPNKMTFD